jgi:hypothetical protein
MGTSWRVERFSGRSLHLLEFFKLLSQVVPLSRKMKLHLKLPGNQIASLASVDFPFICLLNFLKSTP